MGAVQQVMAALGATAGAAAGQAAYTTPGTYSWTAPAGVTSVCVVAVGGGADGTGADNLYVGGGGGGLGWKNDIAVTPGNSYTVVVGARGVGLAAAGDSYFISTATVKGGGAPAAVFGTASRSGGTFTGTGGGNGAFVDQHGGGGAGGYAGTGGSGTGGSGGTGGYQPDNAGGGGGGVGLLGQGTSGSSPGIYSFAGGGAGSGGTAGATATSQFGANGGGYGGGGGGGTVGSGLGAGGAVRIIWGAGRAFPSTNTGDV